MAAGPFLILVNVPPEEWAYSINDHRQIIGRGPAASIVIPKGFSRVSRRHAEVWRDPRGLWLQDLQSRAGTQVNGVWLKSMRPAQVKLHDRIWLGGVEIRLIPEIRATHMADGNPLGNVRDDDLAEGDPTALPGKALPTSADLFSGAELDVLLCLGRGFLQDSEIAQELHRSPNTIRTHVSKIVKILGLRSRNDVLTWLRGKRRQI